MVWSWVTLVIVVLLVDGNKAGSSESDIVLEGVLGTLNLSLFSHTSELPVEFGELGESGSTEWVSLADKSSGGVDDDSSSVGVLSLVDEFSSLSLWAELECLVGD